MGTWAEETQQVWPKLFFRDCSKARIFVTELSKLSSYFLRKTLVDFLFLLPPAGL